MSRGRVVGRSGAAALAVLVVATGLVFGGPSTPPAAAGPVLDDLSGRFLDTRPEVGPTWVVDLAGTSEHERIVLRTLQGVVNRTSARLYLIDPSDAGARPWIEEYQAQGLVSVAGEITPDEAIARFGTEASGYVLADPSQPWSFAAAATLAGTNGAIVATPDTAAWLLGHGLVALDDVAGRWPDAATAFDDVVPASRPNLGYGGIAVLRPSDSAWDFALQQRMPVVLTRPNDPSWSRVSAVITASDPGKAVYGYLSDDAVEEAQAVATLSQAGLVLIPTDTTRNLSFHVAVGAQATRLRARAPAPENIEPCRPEQANVVVALSDGDNLNVPLNRYRNGARWDSGRRGEIPMGWSVAPSLAVLAPAAWDHFARTAGSVDELVGIIGYGYAAPAALADPLAFYRTTFAAMDELGLTTFWSLGGGLEAPGTAGWRVLDEAADDPGSASSVPDQVLAGYGNGSGQPTAFWSAAGRPAFTSGTDYLDGPAELAAQVGDLAARAPGDRPLVAFMSASLWENTYDELADALAPHAAAGVRFLTPAQAAACLPDAPPPPPEPEGACLPVGPISQSGHPVVSPVIAAELSAQPTALPLMIETSAAPSAAAGGATVHHRLRARVDLQALADDVLSERVRPLVLASYGAGIAASTWTRLDASNLVLPVALDPGPNPGLAPVGEPTVEPAVGVGTAATARWGSDPANPTLEVELPPWSARSGETVAPVEVEVRWTTTTASRPEPWTALVVGLAPTANLAVTVGASAFDVPLEGTAAAAWACDPPAGVQAEVAVAAVASTTTTTMVATSTTTTTGPETTTTTTGPATSTLTPPETTSPAAPETTTSTQPETTTSDPVPTSGPGTTTRPVTTTTSTITVPTTPARPAPAVPATPSTAPSGGLAPAAAARPVPGASNYTG